MRRVVGSHAHVRQARGFRVSIPQNAPPPRHLAPSLRAELLKVALSKEPAANVVSPTSLAAPPRRPSSLPLNPKSSNMESSRKTTATRKRSTMSKEHSPRSGLKPQDTIDTNRSTRSASDYGLVTPTRVAEEQRKLSDFGLLPPTTPLSDPEDESRAAPSRSATMPKIRKPSIAATLRTQLTLLTSSPRKQRSPSMQTSPSAPLTPVLKEPRNDDDAQLSAQPAASSSSSAVGHGPKGEMKKSISFRDSVSRSDDDARNAKPRAGPEVSGASPANTTAGTGATSKKEAKRRNSVFVKRGSVSMEPIKKVDIDEVYTITKQLGTGRFGYIKLAEHKQSGSRIAIKFFPRPQIKQVDFIREYNYSFFLSPHPNIIDTYEGMFQTNDDSAFFFVQEFCPCASLREAVEGAPNGIGEDVTRKIMTAVLSAIEFMHNENLVHRNLKAENILIFDKNEYSKVKVTDFGLTRKVDSTVKYLEYVNCYHAPELCETVVNEVLTVNKSIDVWALGVLFYYCLKGRFPWQKATIMCKPYWEWEQWLKRKNPQLPRRWAPFSEKSLKLLKRTLTPRAKDRWSAKDMRKCIAKERLLKPVKSESMDDYVYYPKSSADPSQTTSKPANGQAGNKKKSALHQWINTTLSTMAEISEQVVSARDE